MAGPIKLFICFVPQELQYILIHSPLLRIQNRINESILIYSLDNGLRNQIY
jgi:hypothetical protein